MRGRRRHHPVRVLTSLPGRGPNTNPYLLQLIDALDLRADRVRIEYFSWRRALFGRWDVLHVHWPERLVRARTRRGVVARRMLTAALLVRLSTGRSTVVRTLHNLSSHERGDRVEAVLLAALDRRTRLRIRLNPFTPAAEPVRTIPHGHYRDWFERNATARVPGRVLFFGLVRPYKGIEDLLSAFGSLADAGASLRIVGSAEVDALRRRIEQVAADDHRVTARLDYVRDPELADEVGASSLVVLPYRAVHNSGAAILALSLGRPVLMPATDTTAWLRDEVGAGWMHLYEGDLSAAAIRLALEAGVPDGEPDLTARDWGAAAEAHIEAFEAAVGLR